MFLLGPAYLISRAADQLHEAGRLPGRVATMAAVTVIAVAGSRSAFGAAQQFLAGRWLMGGVVDSLPSATGASSVLLPGSESSGKAIFMRSEKVFRTFVSS